MTAGTHLASSIKVAEAAKVIENTQRDVNIALMNELSILFNKLGLDTTQVLEAAGTKWNFLPFRPGLVGGHCIGVDPYYLAHKSQSIGYHPEIIMSGRRLNDNMPTYVVSQLVKALIKNGQSVRGARILVMGFAFKENCPDVRNTKVIDVINSLKEYETIVDVFDPWVNKEELDSEYGLTLLNSLPEGVENGGIYDAIIIAVAHDDFKLMDPSDLRKLGKEGHILFDLKNCFSHTVSDLRL